MFKICRKCKIEKPATNEYFCRNKQSKDSLSDRCKQCANQYYLVNREKILNSSKANRAKLDPKKKSEYKRNWYIKNKEYVIEETKNWYKNFGYMRKEYMHSYRQNNKDKIRGYNQKRGAKHHIISNNEWEFCKKYFDNSCAYCGYSEIEHRNLYNQDLHREHVVHDGRNDIKNCVPSCKSCNSEKWEHSLNNWYNPDNHRYTTVRYQKIYQWLRFDYKLCIEKKKQ